MTKIKICGLSRKEDIAFANRLLPEYIGFVFAEKSVRRVSKETASLLKSELDGKITAVGVFVNSPSDEIAALVSEGTISAVQLHGSESEEYIQKLRRQISAPIIKAFKISSRDDIEKALASPADFILLDGQEPGSGNAFDWSLIKNANRPFFLAGGLCAENIDGALRLNPYCVDVSSGVESGGIKDFDKMKEFVLRVRADGKEEIYK